MATGGGFSTVGKIAEANALNSIIFWRLELGSALKNADLSLQHGVRESFSSALVASVFAQQEASSCTRF